MRLHQFLLKNGPYPHEVKLPTHAGYLLAHEWLMSQTDLKEYQDWEILDTFVTSVDIKSKGWRLFFHDARIASYIKMTWG